MTESKVEMGNGKLAIILVRGLVNVSKQVKDTLKMLNLTRKNQCAVLENNPIYVGMIKKVKDYVTWGEIDETTFSELLGKRGEEFKGRLKDGKEKYSYRVFSFNNKNYKTYFRLSPPRKGFGRKGIKMPFALGGSLGNRKEKINDLIMRML